MDYETENLRATGQIDELQCEESDEIEAMNDLPQEEKDALLEAMLERMRDEQIKQRIHCALSTLHVGTSSLITIRRLRGAA